MTPEVRDRPARIKAPDVGVDKVVGQLVGRRARIDGRVAGRHLAAGRVEAAALHRVGRIDIDPLVARLVGLVFHRLGPSAGSPNHACDMQRGRDSPYDRSASGRAIAGGAGIATPSQHLSPVTQQRRSSDAGG